MTTDQHLLVEAPHTVHYEHCGEVSAVWPLTNVCRASVRKRQLAWKITCKIFWSDLTDKVREEGDIISQLIQHTITALQMWSKRP